MKEQIYNPKVPPLLESIIADQFLSLNAKKVATYLMYQMMVSGNDYSDSSIFEIAEKIGISQDDVECARNELVLRGILNADLPPLH